MRQPCITRGCQALHAAASQPVRTAEQAVTSLMLRGFGVMQSRSLCICVYAADALQPYGLQANSEQFPASTPRQSDSTATRYSEEAGSCDALSKHRSA